MKVSAVLINELVRTGQKHPEAFNYQQIKDIYFVLQHMERVFKPAERLPYSAKVSESPLQCAIPEAAPHVIEVLFRPIRAKHPLQLPANEDGRAPAFHCEAQPVDFFAEMRALRLQVDGLLAAGQVSEAEQAMEAKRVYLGEHCIYIRKLNQAYFAFHGSYADSAAASDPIGPKIQQLFKLTGDVGSFLRIMRDVTSVKDLDAALSALGGARTP